jgi:DNA-binding GntR family transcriptional regulator
VASADLITGSDLDDRRPPTLSERAAQAIASAIIAGELLPGSRLGIRELSKRLDMGPTPVREALNNLAGRGLVVAVGQKGFRVAQASEADLRDLVAARTVIEVGALQGAMARGGADWEAGVVSALHRLKLFSASPPPTLDERVAEFEKLNRGFHAALIAACGSDRLVALSLDLHDQAQRYRNLMLRVRDVSPNVYEEHRKLADLALKRDTEGACAQLAEHNALTLNLIYGADGGSPGSARQVRRGATSGRNK